VAAEVAGLERKDRKKRMSAQTAAERLTRLLDRGNYRLMVQAEMQASAYKYRQEAPLFFKPSAERAHHRILAVEATRW
jgi:hypothetical protein